jgi:hypothetical protein
MSVRKTQTIPAGFGARIETTKGGWVPDDCIELVGESARARYDYAATELAATVGEELVVTKEKGGWALCTNGSGQSGWLPLANLDRTNKK